MKTLELRKVIPSNKQSAFTYQVIEDGNVIATRKSNRDYIACYVCKIGNSVFTPYFFSRLDLIGKGDSRKVTQWKNFYLVYQHFLVAMMMNCF